MPTGKLPTIDETLNAVSHVGSGANQSAATGTSYRIDSLKFVRFLAEDNCFIAILADTSRTDVRELLGNLAAQGGSATTNARKLASLRLQHLPQCAGTNPQASQAGRTSVVDGT